jgi:NADH-quinone oxidoreductase subunit L
MMTQFLALIPLFPLLGFLILALSQGKLSKQLVPIVGVGSVGFSALLVAGIGLEFFNQEPVVFRQTLWTWMSVQGFTPGFSLYLDALSLTMMFVITGVGFLIHLYSAGYMADDPGYARFFAYMNLFVSAMLVLVLADNLVLLYLGWEGVGLCSYLLIGFWYDDPDNGYAARKAFIVTRVGDTAMILGLFLLFREFATLDIQSLLQLAAEQWQPGTTMAVIVTLLLLGGAVGKSAQLPLQTWLPDAMAGPTPISALIHAATMVTAGVYLIARTHVLFMLAPNVQLLVGFIGAITLVMAGCTALTQTDIKRILAFSTISQIGYMFLALGVGAWSAAIFHLMTHAFFKALLFLAAGAVILSLHHEQNIFKMGGLWKRLPIAFSVFLIGTCALVALPFTSGYDSKHVILEAAYNHGGASQLLWYAGVLGALLTSIYSFRLIFIAFFGEQQTHAEEKLGLSIIIPLLILAVLSIIGGMFRTPLTSVFPPIDVMGETSNTLRALVEAAIPFIGIIIAYLFFYSKICSVDKLLQFRKATWLHQFWFSGWGLDYVYDKAFVQPFIRLAAINKNDIVDSLYTGLMLLSRGGYRLLSYSQNGQVRRYALVMGFGTVVLIGIGVLS